MLSLQSIYLLKEFCEALEYASFWLLSFHKMTPCQKYKALRVLCYVMIGESADEPLQNMKMIHFLRKPSTFIKQFV